MSDERAELSMAVNFEFDGEPVEPRDAATVILVRDGPTGLEVFFVKRRAEVRFMGGAYVFPGGKLDPNDRDPDVPADLDAATAARRLGDGDPARARGLFVAAARECLEESGVLFAEPSVPLEVVAEIRHACDVEKKPFGALLRARGLTLRLSALVPWTRWITPKLETRRFDARFFLAAAPEGVDARHDTRETVESAWLAPKDALGRAHREEIVLVPPTYRSVEVLAQQPDVAHVLAMPPPSVPTLEPVVLLRAEGGVIVALPGDPLHPAAEPDLVRPGSANPAAFATRFVYGDPSGPAWRPENGRNVAR